MGRPRLIERLRADADFQCQARTQGDAGHRILSVAVELIHRSSLRERNRGCPVQWLRIIDRQNRKSSGLEYPLVGIFRPLARAEYRADKSGAGVRGRGTWVAAFISRVVGRGA